ncbi:cell wall metabolism sensor histidine kinase WalK [Actinomyces slackii]|uniref:histidine kinase n=1 Tax=Actinomyces slackii TaxID=52774 RepID=A0A448KBE6_9ACTO|nr:HAMP domain-containing sensor histidine kinase [Actinomyces slackii]VEG74232.1 Probable sensor histidine kinase TcrY [Actinomyces slackii]
MAAARSAARTRAPLNKQHRPIKRGRWHPLIAVQRPWQALPLRSRLALMTTAVLSIGLLISSFVVTSMLERNMINQIDAQLRVTGAAFGTEGLARMNNAPGGGGPLPSTYYVEADYISGDRDGQWIHPDTSEEYGVPQLEGKLDYRTVLANEGDPQIITVDSSNSPHKWRAILMLLHDSNTKEYVGVAAIALPMKNVTETVERTRLVVALADVVIILVGAITSTYLVHRSFRSLRQIESVAGRIAQGDLSARILVTEPSTTEVGSLQRAINTMLTQNEHAFSVQVVAQERMTRFVSDASHELRTPLAAIRGYGELYRMGGVPTDRTGEVMSRIETESNRMGRLVDDLLQLARMDEGREMVMEPLSITELAIGALSDMAVLAPDRDCSLTPLEDPDDDEQAEAPDVQVVGDRDRLSQVLTNLLGNVVRHTPAGTPVEIAVGTQSDSTLPGTSGGQGVAVVEVRDHGGGVPPQEAEKVFQRFYRSDSSRNRETGGSGLGLAIVLGIIERHGGTVQMLQTPGGGATVRIELPLPPSEPDPDADPEPA